MGEDPVRALWLREDPMWEDPVWEDPVKARWLWESA